MKIKKALAFIAAFSMLSVTGVTAFAEEAAVTEIESSAVEITTEAATEATEVTEETVTTETSETATVDGDIEETVIANAIDADFTIGDESFYTKVDSYYIVIYKITDKDSATEVGRIELDALINTVDHYEVYGNQLVVVCYVNGKIATVESYYDSATGKFRYVNSDTDNLDYSSRKQVFELNGISFVADLQNGKSSSTNGYSGAQLNLSINFSNGTATNLQNVPVLEDFTAGDLQGSAIVYNVNNYFKISGDNLIIYYENEYTGQSTSTSYVFDKTANKFVEAGSKPDTPDEKTFTVEIPYTYFNVVGSNTSDTFNGDLRKSMQAISVKITDCSNGEIKSLNGGCSACDENEYLESITVENVKPGKLVIKGTGADARSSDDGSHINAGYYVGQNWYTFEISVNIDENGNIVTGSTGGNNSGTSNNSTGNTTANSPATSDSMSIPAVAGSAALVLGAVIYVSKKRK